MEFWNRSLTYVWSLDGTAPGPGTHAARLSSRPTPRRTAA